MSCQLLSEESPVRLKQDLRAPVTWSFVDSAQFWTRESLVHNPHCVDLAADCMYKGVCHDLRGCRPKSFFPAARELSARIRLQGLGERSRATEV